MPEHHVLNCNLTSFHSITLFMRACLVLWAALVLAPDATAMGLDQRTALRDEVRDVSVSVLVRAHLTTRCSTTVTQDTWNMRTPRTS